MTSVIAWPVAFATSSSNFKHRGVTFFAGGSSSAGGAASPSRPSTSGSGRPLEVLNADQAIKIARFLRVLNAAFNASLTIQRLEAVQTLIRQFQNSFVPIQQKLVELAIVEVDDALAVLQDADITPIQTDAQAGFSAAKAEAQLARSATTHTVRNQHVANALTRMRAGRAARNQHHFLMGQSNLMF